MADDSQSWYPQPGMDQDTVNRILFDNLYQLRQHSTSIQNSLTSIVQQSVTAAIGGGGSSPSAGAAILTGPLEARPATATDATLYIETSRSGIASEAPFSVYVFSATAGWSFVSGKFFRTQAQIAALSATLGVLDKGALVYVAAPYCHNLLWDGAAWGWADPGDRSHRFAHFDTAPGDGWHLVDGSAFAALNADGTTTNVAPPDSTGANVYFLKSGGWTGTTVAAVAPTTAAVSAGTPAGTNSAPALTMNAYTPTGTNSAPTFTGSALGTHAHDAPVTSDGAHVIPLAVNGFGANYSQVAATNYAADGGASFVGTISALKTNAVSAGTPSGTVSAPTFTGNAATLTGTVAAPVFTGAALGTHVHTVSLAGGDPVSYLAAPLYYRQ